MWEGWWGDDPPFHHPVYVLTNYERPALSMKGGTSFHFVTGGPEEALRLARDAAGDLDVRVAGGASTLRQYLVRGLIDELHIAMVPWLLGEGEKLFEGLRDLPKQYECARFESTSRTIHLLLKRIRAT
jgi:dihydrofolate reductase